ncbi:hypothetical protein PoB_001818700 [Plakobranchus ocellatus]|uniref:Uncharacterized protein n=1 Tax=Plakobranchus ocellatus TaxID=259542 RepID=A0AAV3Z8W4_9GAST|nr:hypothetical protein PoB_001818700 [Plakobranchus ocellatus]
MEGPLTIAFAVILLMICTSLYFFCKDNPSVPVSKPSCIYIALTPSNFLHRSAILQPRCTSGEAVGLGIGDVEANELTLKYLGCFVPEPKLLKMCGWTVAETPDSNKEWVVLRH